MVVRLSPRHYVIRVIAAALVLSMSACGGASDARSGTAEVPTTTVNPSSGEPGSTESTTTVGSTTTTTIVAANGICDEAESIGHDLALVDFAADWTNDPQGYVDGMTAAMDRFAAIEPPAAVADSWATLDAFFSMAGSALVGVDATDPTAVEDALRFEGEDAFTMVLVLPGQVETVGVFLQDECGIDLGIEPPVIANVCETLDPAHLDSVFETSTPRGDHRRWGMGVVECMWDDRDGTEVGIVVGPGAVIRADVLQGQAPIDTVAFDGGSIDIHEGALGPLRAASGRTAVTDVGATAVLASVRSGDVDADTLKAIALVGLVADDLD